MLESLVSSRIRRTLLEHLLAHPQDRFYLRGLARRLGLTISPLRRELKRFERLGMLSIAEEANAKFYVVNQTSPHFTQLQSATAHLTDVGSGLPRQLRFAKQSGRGSPEPSAHSHVGFETGSTIGRRWPRLLTAVSVGMALIAIVGVITYLVMANQQLIEMAKHAIGTPQQTPVAVVKATQAGASPANEERLPGQAGHMSSGRWRVLPGTFGGFNAAEPQQESY